MKKALTGAVILSALLVLSFGCQESVQQTMGVSSSYGDEGYGDPLAQLSSADRGRNREAHLVEQMARFRLAYEEQLVELIGYYNQQGNQRKAMWAEDELSYLKSAPRRSYIMVAESAGPNLRAMHAIPEADELFAQGMGLYEQGKGALGTGLMVDKDKLWLAMEKFNQLIAQYPSSDKIDDSAFQIAQINRDHLGDYGIAMLYYQRALQWDPQTVLPVRFAMAKTYDEHLRDRVSALQYYEMAINLEANYPGNVVKAQNRIEAITRELGGN